jgi:hypothetical protein
MQLVDSKLHIVNIPTARGERQLYPSASAFISRLKATSASRRVLVLLLAALVVTASPALLATIRSTVLLSLEILLQAGHAGFIAFQIFGR